jgi:hypothetical protein
MILKPHIASGKALIGCILVTLVIGLVNIRSKVAGISTNFTASEILSIVNAVRQENNLSPLRLQPTLSQAAEAKANAMIATNSWSHNTPTQTPWDFIDQTGYTYAIAGENLAKDFTDPKAVVEAWLNSPSHRENLLNGEYTETGVAVIQGDFQQKQNTTLVVQFLARAATPSSSVKPTYNTTDMITNTSSSNLIYFAIGCLSSLVFGITFLLHQRRRSKKKQNTFSIQSKHFKR